MTPARRTGRTPAERAPTRLILLDSGVMPAESVSPARSLARDALRRRFRAQRRAVVGDARRSAEAAIAERIVAMPRFEQASRIALYRAFDGEVALPMVERAAAHSGKAVVFARIMGQDAALQFVTPAGWRIKKGGLPEPHGPAVTLGAGDLLLVPGVAFDGTGARLGFGGGYYDRTLALTPALAVGVCFECQYADRLPHAPWDQPVGMLVTERGIREFDTEESRV